MLALLGACGGGSGSSAPASPPSNPPVTPPASPPVTPPATPPATSGGPTLVVSPTTVDVQAPTNNGETTRNVQISIQNVGTLNGMFIGGTYTDSGVHHLGYSESGTTLNTVVNFRGANTLSPGVYRDSIVVHACMENPCVTEIAGSPQTITVTYTVYAPLGAPAVSMDRQSIFFGGFTLGAMTPRMDKVNVTFPNLGTIDPDPFVTVSSTSNALARAAYSPSRSATGPAGTLELEPKPSSVVGTGTFTDTVTIRACRDASCTTELAGSPATVMVTTVVTNVEQGTGFRRRGVPGKANNLVWDARRQLIYVALAPGDPSHPNSIGVLDPSSATMLSYTPVGANPRYLELSPDGQYLYVGLWGAGQIQRLALPSMTLDLTIPVGTRPLGGSQLYSLEMHASPDSPHVLGVVRSDISGNAWDIAIFDDAVMRSQSVGGSLTADHVSSFQWQSGSQIFGFSGPFGLASQISVGPAGAQKTAGQQVSIGNEWAAYLLNGRMYTQAGLVYNPNTFAQIGTFSMSANFKVLALDPARAFFLTTGTIQSFDANTLAPIASIAVETASPNVLSRMIRWGYDGLALANYENAAISSNGILLIDGPFVKP
jgi:hypothetical protein